MKPTRFKPQLRLFQIITVIGLSLAANYGYVLWTWPELTDDALNESVSINLAVALSQRGPHLAPDEAATERLREQIRSEIIGQHAEAREKVERRFGIGLLLSVIGCVQLLTSRSTR